MRELPLEACADLVALRRDIHAHPELAFAEHRTAHVVADALRSLDIEVTTGVGGTGVVGVIHGRADGTTVGLRADMDGLPITETSTRAYRSTVDGTMHACGHDGHIAMLLGAARLLAADADLAGDVVLVFQPAEEGEAGAKPGRKQ